MGFSRQECWSGLPCPSPGNLPDSSLILVSCVSCIDRQSPYHFTTWEVLNPPKMKYNKRDSGPAEPVEWKEEKLSRFLTILPSRSCSCRSTPGDKGYSTWAVTSIVSNSLWSLMGCGPSGSSVHGDSPGKNTGVGCCTVLQGYSWPRDRTGTSYNANEFFTPWDTWKAVRVLVQGIN